MTTSLIRALHTRHDPLPLLHDPWGDRLVPASGVEFIHQKALLSLSAQALARPATLSMSPGDSWLHSRPFYTGVITRSRFAEDALLAAVKRGVRQYVLLGAGFDSFSLRRPDGVRDLVVYEIDHPATQAVKRQRMAVCQVTPRAPVHYIAANLSKEGVAAALLRSDFRFNEPVFFSWLGVTMYLSRTDNLGLLGAIGQLAAPGSEVVFNYFDQEAFFDNTGSGPFSEMQRSVTAIGEPLLSGFDPAHLAKDLHGIGLSLQEDLDDAQTLQRYDRLGANGLQPLGWSHVARASVPVRN
ncbi:MAG: class I SAM-dependent methyltransferase [Burkholderiaceae bacterium]